MHTSRPYLVSPAFPHSSASPHCVWQARPPKNDACFAARQLCAPGPALIPPSLALYAPPPPATVAARSCQLLGLPPRPLRPLAPRSRPSARVYAQALFCSICGAEEDPARDFRRAADPPTAPCRRPPPPTCSPPLSHHSHPHFHHLYPHKSLPPSSLTPLVVPHPPTRRTHTRVVAPSRL